VQSHHAIVRYRRDRHNDREHDDGDGASRGRSVDVDDLQQHHCRDHRSTTTKRDHLGPEPDRDFFATEQLVHLWQHDDEFLAVDKLEHQHEHGTVERDILDRHQRLHVLEHAVILDVEHDRHHVSTIHVLDDTELDRLDFEHGRSNDCFDVAEFDHRCHGREQLDRFDEPVEHGAGHQRDLC
jgi:hypothetical protein